MVWLWERKELAATYDLERRNQIIDILTAENVDYKVKASGRNLTSARRAYVGTLGESGQYAVCYHIYVKTVDYDHAVRLLRCTGQK